MISDRHFIDIKVWFREVHFPTRLYIFAGVDVKNDKEDPDKDEKIKKKLAKSVVEYIWMEQGGHLKYGISFIAAQVI